MADGSWRPRQISCRLCREPRTDRDADDDRAQRLMSGADQESRVRVDLTAVVIAVREGVPYVLTVERSVQPKFSLPSGPLEPGHHSLQSGLRSEEHTSELQSLMRISYAVFCLKKTTLKH